MPASYYITHLNTARNSQTKKPSVTLSAAMIKDLEATGIRKILQIELAVRPVQFAEF